MAKRKKYKLVKTSTYSPIIGVLGGKSFADTMPIDYGEKTSIRKEKLKKNREVSTILKKNRVVIRKR